jgi:hypothetical protein
MQNIRRKKKILFKNSLLKSMKFVIPVTILLTAVMVFPSMAFAQTPNPLPGEHDCNNKAISSSEHDYKNNISINFVTAAKKLTADNKKFSVIKSSWTNKKPVVLKGKGTLKASGDGAIRIKGRTDKIEDGIVKISGNGVLLIKDFKGDMDKKITGHGGMVELKKGFLIYYGFKGDATIKGSGFIIDLFGQDLDIYAKGNAVIFLAGEGSYNVERYIKPEEDV